ncbi:MAG: hypothetical protein AAFY21_12700 [Cyanobacteria bacterium J06641_2]
MSDINIDNLIAEIKQLWELREKLLKQDLAPEGAWIHRYHVTRAYKSGAVETYTYAKWQADKPIFKRNPKKNARPVKPGKNEEYTNHLHIGSVDNNWEAVERAYQSWENRQRLETIEKALKTVENVVSEVITSEQILAKAMEDKVLEKGSRE